MYKLTIPLAITLSLSLAACGEDQTTYTAQGADILSDFFDADCTALESCGFGDPADHALCVDYKLTVACSTVPADCQAFHEVPAREFERCLDDMLKGDCDDVERGVLPSSCVVLEEITLTNPYSPWN